MTDWYTFSVQCTEFNFENLKTCRGGVAECFRAPLYFFLDMIFDVPSSTPGTHYLNSKLVSFPPAGQYLLLNTFGTINIAFFSFL